MKQPASPTPFRLLLAFACGTLAACAGTGDKPPPPNMGQLLLQLTEQNGRACFYVADIQGAGVLGQGVVSVSTQFNSAYYLVTAPTRCSWLTPMSPVGFQASGSQVCGGGASNLVSESYNCPISHVFKFPSRKEAMTAWELARAKAEVQQRYSVPGK